jgi:hypothetical protein
LELLDLKHDPALFILKFDILLDQLIKIKLNTPADNLVRFQLVDLPFQFGSDDLDLILKSAVPLLQTEVLILQLLKPIRVGVFLHVVMVREVGLPNNYRAYLSLTASS